MGESVRIDLRRGNVLNSKTEYSRCRLPRLTIDREEWKTAKEKEKKVSEEEDTTVDDELIDEEMAWLTEEESAMATWNGNNHRERSKRKTVQDQDVRGSKRKKLDLLVDWGEHGEDEKEEGNIRSWLTGEREEESAAGDVMVDTLLVLEKPTKRLKQLELHFGMLMDDRNIPADGGKEVVEHAVGDVDGSEVRMMVDTPIVKRKKTLKKLASENQKLTSWFYKVSRR